MEWKELLLQCYLKDDIFRCMCGMSDVNAAKQKCVTMWIYWRDYIPMVALETHIYYVLLCFASIEQVVFSRPLKNNVQLHQTIYTLRVKIFCFVVYVNLYLSAPVESVM